MHRRIVECVANFSEGRDVGVVGQIESAIRGGHGVAVLHTTMDSDHHRCVITFAGTPDGVISAAVRAVRKAAELIDLRRHRGVHPRLGAADVIPLVPIEGITMPECVELAWQLGEKIWNSAGIPVYYYEAAAKRPDRRRLEDVRRGQFEGIRDALPANPDRGPDVGGPLIHPSAGAVIVGARKVLIAYNIVLDTADIQVAKTIAKHIRASSGGFPHVKALGLPLASRGRVQVSMNLTDYEETPLHIVYSAVARDAEERGVGIVSSEFIGLIPRAALEGAAAAYMRVENFSPEIVLENRLLDLLPLGLSDLLDNLASPTGATGGGSAAAVSGAMAASLGVVVCRLTQQDTAVFEEYRRFFETAVEANAEAFDPLMRQRQPPEQFVQNAAEVPLRVAEQALRLQHELTRLRSLCPPDYQSDAITAEGLAAAARNGAVCTARLNLFLLSDEHVRNTLENRLREVE